jgi:diguanylate cyclase (GGDEF)-like protein
MWLSQRSSRAPTRAAAATHAASTPSDGLEDLSTVKRLAAGRPPIVWSLSLLFAFKSLVAFAVVAFPLSSQQPSGLIATGGVVTLAGASGIWLLGSRISMAGFELLAATGVLTASGLVADARTTGGMMVAALSYPWVAIYAAHFFPRRMVNALGLLISAAFACGLALSDLPQAGIYWFVVTATVWSICIVLGGLSDGLRRQVSTDQLTGVLNRTGFAAAAMRERAIADRAGVPLTIAAIDLDDFKQINDRAGHAAGDRLLSTLASHWRARLRPGDILARHGGDEFVLLLPSTSEREANAVLARLCNDEGPVSWSVGVCQWLPGEELSAVLARADTRLYDAKLAKPRRSVDRGERSLSRLTAARVMGES